MDGEHIQITFLGPLTLLFAQVDILVHMLFVELVIENVDFVSVWVHVVVDCNVDLPAVSVLSHVIVDGK